MKFLVVFAVAVSWVAADVSHVVYGKDAEAPILKSSYDISPEGDSFQYAYETGNGITQQAEGVVKNKNSDSPALEVRGSVRYISPDGTPVNFEYISNENGFQPTGDHLPVPPPIPELILRSLQYIESQPKPVVVPERVYKTL